MKLKFPKFILVLVCLSLQTIALHAQDGKEAIYDSTTNEFEETVEEEIPVDSVFRFVEYALSKDSIDLYKKSADFAYVKNLDSLLKLIKLKADTMSMERSAADKKKKRRSTSTTAEDPSAGASWISSPFIKILLWIAAGLFIIFILYKLFFSQGFFKKDVSLNNSHSEPEMADSDVMNMSDLDRQIMQAMQSENYRLAVRFLFLQTLNKLSDSGKIQYSPDKTNYQYVRELNNNKYQNDFASLTLSYEYVWYGKFEIDKNICDRLHNQFKQFNQNI